MFVFLNMSLGPVEIPTKNEMKLESYNLGTQEIEQEHHKFQTSILGNSGIPYLKMKQKSWRQPGDRVCAWQEALDSIPSTI